MGCSSPLIKEVQLTHHQSGQLKKIIPIYIDKDFNLEERNQIGKAVLDWNYSLNGMIQLNMEQEFDMNISILKSVMEGNGFIIMKINEGAKFIPETQGEKTLAWADQEGGHKVYVINGRVDINRLDDVIRHELGHLLGAKHSGDSRHLMFKHQIKNNYDCIDRETALNISLYHNLDIHKMNYCF